MDRPKKPGEIKIAVPKPVPHDFSNRAQWPGPWWVPFAVLFSVFLAPFLYIMVSSIGDNKYLGSSATPSASQFVVPSRPMYPGQSATFTIRSNGKHGQDEHYLIFTYEHLTIIPIEAGSIPTDILIHAITFDAKSETVTSVWPEKPKETVGQSLKFSFGNGNQSAWIKESQIESKQVPYGFNKHPLKGVDQQLHKDGKQTPYIIYGDVDISCGPLVGKDSGVLEAVVQENEVQGFEVKLEGSPPRGPPPSDLMMSFGNAKPNRVIYVVGQIKSFKGPVQRDHSSMTTKIVDLSPSKSELAEFDAGKAEWYGKLAVLASKYAVPIKDLEPFEGHSVDIVAGKVSHPPKGVQGEPGTHIGQPPPTPHIEDPKPEHVEHPPL